MGEDEKTVKEGIKNATAKMAKIKGITSEDETQKLNTTITSLLSKIQQIAEKVQLNTSKMIADEQFLSQPQVAETVLALCDDEISKILNGKVIPGDRVFYPVKPHITSTIPDVPTDFGTKVVVFTVDASEDSDIARTEFLAQNIEKSGGKVVILFSKNIPKQSQDRLSKFHSHAIDLTNQEELKRWFGTATEKVGAISMIIHVTGKVPSFPKITELSRSQWDSVVDKFILTPAIIGQECLGAFVPGGAKNPPLFKGKSGTMVIIGPDFPVGPKVTGAERAKVDVFRGALRPFTTTVNQELSDVLKSNVRIFLVLPGSVDGTDPNNERVFSAVRYFSSGKATSSSEVIFYPDETRS